MTHDLGSRAGVAAAAAALFAALLLSNGPTARSQPAGNSATACPGDNGGITLSPGFCATVFADNLGHARHLVVAPNGVVYVNTWSGAYYQFGKAPAGGFLLALKDSTGSGHADIIKRFGAGITEGAAGGTGIAFYKVRSMPRKRTRSSAMRCQQAQSFRKGRRR